VDPGVVVYTNNVGRFVTGLGESWEWEEASGHSIRWEFMSSWTLESYDSLGLILAIGDTVGVVAYMNLGGIGEALVARGLISNSLGTLEECGLTALSYRVDSVLVETAGG